MAKCRQSFKMPLLYRLYPLLKRALLFASLVLTLSACNTTGSLSPDLAQSTPTNEASATPQDADSPTDSSQTQTDMPTESVATDPNATTVPLPQSNPQDSAPKVQTALAEQQPTEKPKKTALFSFGKKKQEPELTPQPTQQAETQQTTTPQVAQQAQIADDTASNSPSEPSGTVQVPPQRDAQSQQKGSLMRLFGSSKKEPKLGSPKPEEKQVAAIVPLPKTQPPHKKDPSEYNDVLPGVRPNGGIVIKHRSSLYDDTDIDANESDYTPTYTLASLGGLGRNLPNGLRVAREGIEVSCLKPQLVGILKTIERRFGQPVIITSGYRSPAYNRKVNGAKRSMHMACAAADIQVPGVSKMEVAKFVRALPGRGGVGTYCHQSIHVDVGPKRDWNWACSAKK